MKMPLDWPRINQFPEWFTVQGGKRYTLHDLVSNTKTTYTGRQLQQGITITLQPGIQYRLLVATVPHVQVTDNDSFLQIRVDGNKVLQYNHALVPPPKGASKNYIRSGFIHPLWSPAGQVLTQIHPKDHIHHMGIWMLWTNTEFEGRKIDFWNLKAGKATVRFKKFLSQIRGPVYAGFQAQHEHVDLTAPQGEKVALNETWDVRVYNLGGHKKYGLFDFTSIQCCASPSPLHLLEYRYGGLGFRATSKWTKANSDYLTSEGKTRKDGHGTRARWCDISGITEEHWEGVTIMSHPKNFRHPELMCSPWKL
jgi:hypothetical protein